MSFINWVKTHKLIVALVLIIAYLFLNNNPITPLRQFSTSPAVDHFQGVPSVGMMAPEGLSFPREPAAPLSDTSNRIVTKTSDLSLVVKDVRGTGDQIISYAKSIGGFMVFASYNRPTESPFANVTIRIPTEMLDEALSHIRSLSIKVTSENLVGTDVTDEYIDIEARLAMLRNTQARFEEIMDQAVEIQDILTIQRELINLQQQIDSLIGQKQSIENNVKLTKVTIYLSTDELALPYAPDNVFRPDVTFKLAVRSLLSTLRDGANMIIWLGVYSVILIPLLIAAVIFYKKFMKKQKTVKEA
ncbi:MAG: hypothetical protein ACD_37C00697G0001 [uncultured bacterium]|nr:MAG: hypothetical protein ACD_37C00697G0001 [uncultured bacterium]OGH14452.1 MAG: hypothetical protein A2687_03565 [Candidatus Levybacteria bacterium RIFCSPHIGHO2_01_FULL_38_26]